MGRKPLFFCNLKNMQTIYKCWLPNASAYISLKHLGGVGHSRNLYEDLRPIDPMFPNWRSFLQHRPLTERPGFTKDRHSQAGYAFLFQAVIKEDSSTGLSKDLKGVVYVVPHNYAAHLKELHESQAAATASDKSNFLLDRIQTDNGASIALMAMKFVLEADGYLQIESLHSTTNFENPSVTNHSYGQHNAFEIYSFLRDAFHKHKFHSARDDYSLEPYVVKCKNDYGWIGQVVRSLHRNVISDYRIGAESSCTKALGKLAYLESFFAATKQRGLEVHFPKLNLESLKTAIGVTKQEKTDSYEHKNNVKQMAIATVAIVISVFFVLLQLLQVPCIEGLNYDYRESSYSAHGDAIPSTGNCTSIKFAVSPNFLEVASYILKHLLVLSLGTFVLFIIAISFVYKSFWVSQLQSWYLSTAPSLFRYAIAEPEKVKFMIAQIMLTVFLFSIILIAQIHSFNPAWWVWGEYLAIGIGVLSGGVASWTFIRIYKSP